MPAKLIVFDFDGTLADTTALILWTYRAAIGSLGFASRTGAECRATIGLPLREGFRQLYPDCTEAGLDNCTATYRRIFNDNKAWLVPKLYPGVKPTLEALHSHGIEMSVASSRSNASLMEFCSANGLTPFFKLVLGADDVARAKPDPEPVLRTLAALGHEPASTLVVGDMPVDIAMGRGAGCRTVGVAYGNSGREELSCAGADWVIGAFPELLAYVMQLGVRD